MAGRRGRAIYETPAWRALRLEAREAAAGRCQTCFAMVWGTGELHHVDPLARGGPAIPPLDGVRWSCRPCHFREHHPRPERHAWDRLIAELRSPDTGTSATR